MPAIGLLPLRDTGIRRQALKKAKRTEEVKLREEKRGEERRGEERGEAAIKKRREKRIEDKGRQDKRTEDLQTLCLPVGGFVITGRFVGLPLQYIKFAC